MGLATATGLSDDAELTGDFSGVTTGIPIVILRGVSLAEVVPFWPSVAISEDCVTFCVIGNSNSAFAVENPENDLDRGRVVTIFGKKFARGIATPAEEDDEGDGDGGGRLFDPLLLSFGEPCTPFPFPPFTAGFTDLAVP